MEEYCRDGGVDIVGDAGGEDCGSAKVTGVVAGETYGLRVSFLRPVDCRIKKLARLVMASSGSKIWS
jgi:hypothetical protein